MVANERSDLEPRSALRQSAAERMQSTRELMAPWGESLTFLHNRRSRAALQAAGIVVESTRLAGGLAEIVRIVWRGISVQISSENAFKLAGSLWAGLAAGEQGAMSAEEQADELQAMVQELYGQIATMNERELEMINAVIRSSGSEVVKTESEAAAEAKRKRRNKKRRQRKEKKKTQVAAAEKEYAEPQVDQVATSVTGITDNKAVEQQESQAEEKCRVQINIAAEDLEEYAVQIQEPTEAPKDPCNEERARESQTDSERGNRQNTRAGYGQQAGWKESVAAEDALMMYCIQLAGEKAAVESEETSVAIDADATKWREEQTNAVETTEDWAAVLDAVEMAKKAELAQIRWAADAEVNKWMSAVETSTTVELTRDKIQEKVDKVEMGKEKVEKVEAEQQQMNFELENGAQVAY